MSSALSLTDEQLRIVESFQSQESLAIQALAGTGKTATLIALAESAPHLRGHYFAFNEGVARDAGTRLPPNTTCSTTHAFALSSVRALGFDSATKLLNNANVPMIETVLPDAVFAAPVSGSGRCWNRVTPRQFAVLVHSTIRNFVRSDTSTITWEHLPDTPFLHERAAKEHFFGEYGVVIKHVWNRMADPSDAFPLGHDGYLKLWALAEPQIAVDFILLDEAQDTTDVMLGVLRRQACPIVYVGDSHQQIYGWRGAVNALGKVRCDSTCTLTTSFRFGPNIAEIANRILCGLGPLRLKGFRESDEVHLTRVPTRAVLCRTNRDALEEAFRGITEKKKIHIIGGIEDLLVLLRDVEKLANGRPADHPDLFGFEGLNDLSEFCERWPDSAGTLSVILNLRKQFGSSQIERALISSVADERTADLTISTVHRAKGLEWDSVRLSEDFCFRKGGVSEAEKRLHYVGVTRAKSTLCLSDSVLQHISF